MESVNIATLKAKLSHYLRAVRRGASVKVLDRQVPIARIIPFDSDEDPLPSRLPSRPIDALVIPAHAEKDYNSLDALIEERQNSR